jgi:iron complex outermembrane receptor protein
MNSFKTRRAMWLAATAFAALATPAFAQEVALADEAPAARQVETVIVSATRRDEKLQDVAIAVTAIGESALANAGVKDIKDLTQLAPSLAVPVSESSASVSARIRGVGTQGSNPGLESAVGVFVDGVVRARNGVAFGDLGEIQRVEVLRGPQGTLFGRNTSAGLINVVTKKPSFTAGGNAEITVGSFDEYGFSAGLTGPIVEDKIAGRIFVAARQREGWFKINPGKGGFETEDHNREYYTVRGQLLIEPTDTFSFRLIADYSDRNEACCASANVISGPTAALMNSLGAQLGLGTVIGTGNRVADLVGYANRTYDQDITDAGLSGEATWDVGPGTLTSVTAYRNWDYTAGQDSDFTGLDLLYRLNDGSAGTEFRTFTQEFRYAGETGIVNWLFGAFYSDEKLQRRDKFTQGADYERWISALAGQPANPTFITATLRGAGLLAPTATAFTPGGSTNDIYNQRASSIAGFTHNEFQFTDKFKVTLGLRYTTETKTFDASYRTTGNDGCRALERVFGLNPAANAGALAGLTGLTCLPWTRSALDGLVHKQKTTENEWSGVITAAYRLTDTINTYATFSRGYKGGGFNLDRAYSTPLGISKDPRISIVGTGAARNTLIAQPDTSFPAEFVDSYELGAKTEWFDGDLVVNVAAYSQQFTNYQLNTFTGVSFIVTPIKEVNSKGFELDASWRTPVDGLRLNGGLAYSDAKYGKNLGPDFVATFPGSYLLPGKQLTSAPEWTVTGSGVYEWTIVPGIVGIGYLDARYTSDQITGSNLDPRKTQGAYTLLNGRFTVGAEDERWSVELWGRNLTDEAYFQIAFDQTLQGTAPNPTLPPDRATSTIGSFVGEPRTVGATVRFKY